MSANKMTLTELKKKLKETSAFEMSELICALYKADKISAEIIKHHFSDSENYEELIYEYKEKIRKVFFPDRNTNSFSLAKAKSYITEFKKMCLIKEHILDLQLYYVECGTKFQNEYGDMWEGFYDSMQNVFEKIAKELNKQKDNTLFNKLNERIRYNIQLVTDKGWGFYDGMIETYNEIIWVKEDEKFTY